MKHRGNRTRHQGNKQPLTPLPSNYKAHRHHRNSHTSVLYASALSLTLVILYLFTSRDGPSPQPGHPRSLLETHSTAHLPPCSAHRLSLKDASGPPLNDKPTIYTDWTINSEGLDTTSSFVERYGHVPQYIKMGDALPLFDMAGEFCVAPFKVIIDTLVRRFINSSVISENGIPKKRATNDDLLIFTNDLESPEIFDTILTQYSLPDPLSFTANYVPPPHSIGWTKIFSAMMQRSAHRFHVHKDAWLGQVSGSRMWFLLPPSTPFSAVEKPPPACEYLYNREALPNGAMMCIQNPGEVMYLPKNWWHATCGLEEWNVGVGEQLGAPALSAPRAPAVMSEDEWEEKLIECGKGGAFGAPSG